MGFYRLSNRKDIRLIKIQWLFMFQYRGSLCEFVRAPANQGVPGKGL